MTRADFAWHGGCLAQARATFGEGPEPWIDLSTGINPLPWPGAGALEPDWHSLPDPQALAALEAIAARHFCVDPALCCAVPGSEMALRLLGTVTGQTGAHLAPAYRTHAVACPEAIDLVARPPSEARLLLLANDSVAGPFAPLGPLLARVDFAMADIWGATDSRERGYHLQSYLTSPYYCQG